MRFPALDLRKSPLKYPYSIIKKKVVVLKKIGRSPVLVRVPKRRLHSNIFFTIIKPLAMSRFPGFLPNEFVFCAPDGACLDK